MKPTTTIYDILDMVDEFGFRAIYLDEQPYEHLLTFLIFDTDVYRHWSVGKQLLEQSKPDVKEVVRTMLINKFASFSQQG